MSATLGLWVKRVTAVFVAACFVAAVVLYWMIYVSTTNRGLTFENTLRIPRELFGVQDAGRVRFDLVVSEGQQEFLPGVPTATAGVNGPYLGPTLRLRRGDLVDLRVRNELQEETTMHWHGMHVPAEMDGTPHQIIEPDEAWTASFEVDQQAATLWYHPHTHEETGRQAYLGIAGLLIIDDEESERLELPNTYGVDDIPLIIQDRRFDRDSQFLFELRQGAVYGDHILVNGTSNPRLSVEARLIRFRLLNGSNARIYYLGFDDDREFFQIATDGGFLEEPYRTTRVVLAPGERAEILVDFSDSRPVVLKSYPEAGLLQTVEAFFDGAGSGHFDILRFDPSSTSTESHTIPSRLNSIERIAESKATRSRPMRLGGFGPGGGNAQAGGDGRGGGRPGNGPTDQNAQGAGRRQGGRFGSAPPINGKRMDMHRIDEVVRLGDTEIWDVTNQTGQPHPFHVHLVQFQVLDRDGEPPAGAERGWKDTVLVRPGERVRIIMSFTRYADPKTPYMYHCHIMEHEDRGMMGQFLVVEEPPALVATEGQPTVAIFIIGFGCEHCLEQVLTFDRELASAGINLLVVTPDETLDRSLVDSLSATVVADPDGRWAGWLGLLHEGPAHGTYLIDKDGDVTWGDDSETPFTDYEAIIRRVSGL